MLLPLSILLFQMNVGANGKKIIAIVEKNIKMQARNVFFSQNNRWDIEKCESYKYYLCVVGKDQRAEPTIGKSVWSNLHQIEPICSFPILFVAGIFFQSFFFSCAKQSKWKTWFLLERQKSSLRSEWRRNEIKSN